MRTKTSLKPFALLLVIFATAAASRAADANENWTHYCIRCHGSDGTGSTKMGRKLHIKNLTQPKIQSRLTDDRIREAIAEGNKNDEGEEQMPSFREKLTDAERNDLVVFIRSLAKGS